MMRLITHALWGAAGVATCFIVAMLSQAIHLTPSVPAPGGEDDFSFRATLFFFGVCPAFAILGAWVSVIAESSIRAGARSWAGAVVGSFLVLIAARTLRTRLEGLTGDGEGNQAIALLFACWIVAAALGAYLLRPRRVQSRDA